MKHYTEFDPPTYSVIPRTVQQLGNGCFRKIPDIRNEQPQDWYARLSQQRPETVGPTGRPKRKARQRYER